MTTNKSVPPSREQKLLTVIGWLWDQVKYPNAAPDVIEDAIRARGLGWTLPHLCPYGDDDLLTPDQIGDELGYDAATVRVWGHRYRLQQVDGLYRWSDIRRLGR